MTTLVGVGRLVLVEHGLLVVLLGLVPAASCPPLCWSVTRLSTLTLVLPAAVVLTALVLLAGGDVAPWK